ncbi:macrophage mannose receptor 1-like [Scomber scombrus]|uniref:macrophage mannose receptor 1-like n=1 Tax=Scomber scombrus TaxID=13677 RepID=UPI002DD82E99|nr:macrophage mannose receptor 1-like [Scomber scombrus]
MMEKVLLSIIAASVLCVVSSHVQHQYHFVYEVKNMTEAQSYCRDKYTDLATIDDMEDVKTLTDMVDLNKMVLDEDGQATVWIGLYDDEQLNSWRWSDRHAEVEFTNWAKGEPNNDGSVEYCTEMYDPGVWNDLRCARTLRAVCSSVRGSDVKFILINTTMNWTEAQSYCRANYTDLATVRNEAENQEVKNLTDGEEVWIGLFKDSWKWSDGSNSSFRYWASGEPNNYAGKKEDCVAMNFNHAGGWEDWNCDQNKPFICYKGIFTPSSSFPETTEQFAEIDPKHKMRVSVKMNSALDLNNPEVMEEVLKQLKQRMKEKGVNEDVKLSWKKQPDGKVFHKEKKKTFCLLSPSHRGRSRCTHVKARPHSNAVDTPKSGDKRPAHQYHFVYEVKNMKEAQSYCRDKYTDLATIDDMEDVKTLTGMMDLNKMVLDEDGQATVWIGLYDDEQLNSWRWSDRHAEVEFKNWKKGQPDNYMSVEHCTMMLTTGKWNDERCDRTLRAVCSSVRGSNVTFILINSTMSWTEAQSYCRANYTDLATVRNEAENQEVKNLTDGEWVWIGLFRDSWKWSDGSNSSFRYWKSGEPNGGKKACVAMNFNRSGGWGDWTCDQNKPFICYKEIVPKHKMRVSVKMNSALDLNNPEVMEEVLKQESFETVVERRTLNKLFSIMDIDQQPLHHTVDRQRRRRRCSAD